MINMLHFKVKQRIKKFYSCVLNILHSEFEILIRNSPVTITIQFAKRINQIKELSHETNFVL